MTLQDRRRQNQPPMTRPPFKRWWRGQLSASPGSYYVWASASGSTSSRLRYIQPYCHSHPDVRTVRTLICLCRKDQSKKRYWRRHGLCIKRIYVGVQKASGRMGGDSTLWDCLQRNRGKRFMTLLTFSSTSGEGNHSDQIELPTWNGRLGASLSWWRVSIAARTIFTRMISIVQTSLDQLVHHLQKLAGIYTQSVTLPKKQENISLYVMCSHHINHHWQYLFWHFTFLF